MKTKDLRTKVTAEIPPRRANPAFVTVPPSYGRESTREPTTTRTTDEEPEMGSGRVQPESARCLARDFGSSDRSREELAETRP